MGVLCNTLVVCGYHRTEADFGRDVRKCYLSHGLRQDRLVGFYHVRNSSYPMVPSSWKRSDAELKDVAQINTPAFVIDLHVFSPMSAQIFEDMALDEKSVNAIAWRMPLEMFDRLPSHILDLDFGDDLFEDAEYWMAGSAASMGLPTVVVEPVLLYDSVVEKNGLYQEQVRKVAHLINSLHDAVIDGQIVYASKK